MEPDSSRCAACPTEFELSSESKVLRQWASYGELNQSADAGCDFCALCRQYLTHRLTIDVLQQKETEIQLSAWSDLLSLKCLALNRSVNLPLVGEAETGGQNRPNFNPGIFIQAAVWLRDCNSHRSCRAVTRKSWQTTELPKRLIDLSGEDTLHVFECQDRVDMGTLSRHGTRYCTLSYRWGDAAHSSVLTESFTGDFAVSLNSLPQTFQDAVTVTRKLRIRYLWIDALCIVQPTETDDSEWLEEGSRMGSIYQNAECTIAATAANNANQGFLERTGNSVSLAKPMSIYKKSTDESKAGTSYIPINVPSFYDCISVSALNRRGWVVQERALSTRVIHFTVNGVFWECGSLKAHDTFGTLQNRGDFPSCRSKETLLSVARLQRTRHVCPVEWFHFVQQYSYSHFTNPQDRLLALSSVAKAVQPYLGGHDYIAGLWKNDIVKGLAWKCYAPIESIPDDPNVPSWSWAAAKGGVSFAVFAIRMNRFNLVEVVETSATPLIRSNPFSRLTRGTVTLKGRLTRESLARPPIKEFDSGIDTYWDDGKEMDESIPNRLRLKRYTLLPIAMDKPVHRYETYIGALILEPVGKAELVQRESGEMLRSEFRRIGWIEYSYQSRHHWDWRQHWAERDVEEIVLV